MKEKLRIQMEISAEKIALDEGMKRFKEVQEKLTEGGLIVKPLPEQKRSSITLFNPAEELMINTVPLPDSPMIDTVHLPEKGLMIGTWPTPEKGLMIGTWPTPERVGIMPMPAKALSSSLMDKITEGMPRFKLNKDIYGGIRNAHLHLGDEIILLNKRAFKDVVGEVAKEIARDLVEELI